MIIVIDREVDELNRIFIPYIRNPMCKNSKMLMALNKPVNNEKAIGNKE
jgi:hypothetical protein